MATKEKFEEAKRLYETANADQRYVLESLFPELKESEDERIRKALRERIIRYDPNNEILIKEEGISQRQFLAWIEKQAQKHDWSERDEKLLNDAISLADECDDIELRDWLKSIKERFGK